MNDFNRVFMWWLGDFFLDWKITKLEDWKIGRFKITRFKIGRLEDLRLQDLRLQDWNPETSG